MVKSENAQDATASIEDKHAANLAELDSIIANLPSTEQDLPYSESDPAPEEPAAKTEPEPAPQSETPEEVESTADPDDYESEYDEPEAETTPDPTEEEEETEPVTDEEQPQEEETEPVIDEARSQLNEEALRLLEEGRERVKGKPRYKPRDEAEELAFKTLVFMDAFKDKPVEEVVIAARKMLDPNYGKTAEPDPSTVESANEVEPPTQTETKSVPDLQKELRDLSAEKDDIFLQIANMEMDEEDAKQRLAEIRDRQFAIDDEIDQVENETYQQQQSLYEAEQAAFAKLYKARPEAKDPESAYAKALGRIQNGLLRAHDPVMDTPEWPLYVQELADLQLGYGDDAVKPKMPAKPAVKENPPVRASQHPGLQKRTRAAVAPAPGSAKTKGPDNSLSSLMGDRKLDSDDLDAIIASL